jgi:hypothetical protein
LRVIQIQLVLHAIDNALRVEFVMPSAGVPPVIKNP